MSDQSVAIPPRIGADTMEKVLLQGDLKALSPRERVSYYDGVCKSLGLNPLTRPFEYLTLNNRLILYARRECTEQLRQIRGVSVKITARELTEGCYCVTAAATLQDGRQDESIGAVPIEGLKGESKANAMMKAETKAKRRVTLSICGLAFLDESELDSLRETQSPEPVPMKPWGTFRQMLEKFAEAKQAFGPENESAYYHVLRSFGVEHSNQFTDSGVALNAYRQLQETIENFPPAPATGQ